MYKRQILGKPSRGTHRRRSHRLGHNGFLENLIPALDRDGQRLVGTEPDARLQLFPGWVLNAVDLHDPVAWLQAGASRSGVVLHSFNDRRLVEKNRILIMHHVNGSEQEDG